MTRSISIPQQHIEDFCHRWRVTEMAIERGSINAELRSETNFDETDLGVFIRFDPSAEWNLTDKMRMESELQKLSGHSVRLRNQHRSSPSRWPGMRVLYDA